MKIVSVGTVAFDAIETPYGKTDKIVEELVLILVSQLLTLIHLLT